VEPVKRTWGLSVFPALVLVFVALQLGYPHSFLVSQVTGGGVALSLCALIVAGTASERQGRKAELERDLAKLDGAEERYNRLTAELRSGMLTADEFRDKLAEASKLVELMDARTRKAPMAQLRLLSDQYGLPVVTPLQKSEPLPVVVAPPDPAARVDGIPAPEPEYVPAGQAELSRDLLELIRDEVTTWPRLVKAAASVQGRQARLHWRMSPEWLEEVRKLRTSDTSGALLYRPRERQSRSKYEGKLYGYPVTVGDFGVPELVAS
jgi:hypothetical protein